MRILIRIKTSGTDITYNPTMSVSDDDIWLMACIIDWETAHQFFFVLFVVFFVFLRRVFFVFF